MIKIIFLIFPFIACATVAETSATDETRWFGDAQPGWEGGEWRFRTSVYTRHYHPRPEHNNHQRLIGIEYRRDDAWLAGAAYFRNSFHQPTLYLYAGKEWLLWQHEHFRLRGSVTGGLIYGYRDEYRDKIPCNRHGVAPVVLPAVVLDYRQLFMELQFLAASGMLATVGFRYSPK
ncbi:MAG: sn-glycerol-3-phosphate transporter [Cardiobacteriaceae bacterium]|nr:sn-glycerol-3-phosphate transporter [Cardiobacteriaceae bacterium]